MSPANEPARTGAEPLRPEVLGLLRCPVTGQRLTLAPDGRSLVTPDGTRRYPIRDGLPVLTPTESGADQT